MSRIKEIFEKHSYISRGKDGNENDWEQKLLTFEGFEKALSELGVWMGDEQIEMVADDYTKKYNTNKVVDRAYKSISMDAVVFAMKHYRDKASTVRFVSDAEINREVKVKSNMRTAAYCEGYRHGMNWMRDLIFKNKEG